MFRGFSWENCGKPDDPRYVKTLHVYPNPIPSPGYVIAAASASTSVDLRSPFPVNLTLEREVAGVWVKVPCVDDLGSCYYPDACERLAQLFMTDPELCLSSPVADRSELVTTIGHHLVSASTYQIFYCLTG